MIKKFSKKYLLSFSIASTIGMAAFACGWYYDNYFQNSSFAPEIFVDESLSPMFFYDYSFFYETTQAEDHNDRFRTEISKYWAKYLDGILDTTSINEILFNEELYPLKRIHEMTYVTSSKEKDTHLPIAINKFKAFVNYMYVARSIDQSCTSSKYSWNVKESDPINLNDIHKIAFSLYNSTDDEAFKQKSWLLILKMYFYHFNEMTENQQNMCTDLYKNTANTVSKNIDYYRALGYMAGVYYKQKRFSESNYLYTKIFLHCSELKNTAIFSYHPLEVDELRNNTLLSCTNNEEKCALWALQGFYTNERVAMNEIAKIDINSKFLPLMMSRAINKAESKINSLNTDSTFVTNVKMQYAKVDDENKSLYHQIKQISEKKDLNDKFVWQTALGYIEMLHNKNTDADKSFEIARQWAPKTSEAKNQIRILQLINNLNKIKKITPDCFKNIASEINWLLVTLRSSNEENNAEIGAMSKRIKNAQNWVADYLCLLYKDNGNNTMSTLYDNFNEWDSEWSKNNLLDDGKTIYNILSLLKKKSPTIMEETAIKVGKLTQQDIYDFINIKAVFDNRLSDTYNINDFYFPANPFNSSIQDNHDAEHAKNKTYSYKKLIETMKMMQTNIADGKDLYNNSLLLGNAFYSISHYGNCRLTSKLTGNHSNPDLYRPEMMKMISNCDNAEKYYQIAYNAATDNEQRAKCAYMLAKCERNKYYNENDAYEWNSNSYMLLEWTGFKLLREKYSDTKYYKEVIDECGYFKMYSLAPEIYHARKVSRY